MTGRWGCQHRGGTLAAGTLGCHHLLGELAGLCSAERAEQEGLGKVGPSGVLEAHSSVERISGSRGGPCPHNVPPHGPQAPQWATSEGRREEIPAEAPAALLRPEWRLCACSGAGVGAGRGIDCGRRPSSELLLSRGRVAGHGTLFHGEAHPPVRTGGRKREHLASRRRDLTSESSPVRWAAWLTSEFAGWGRCQVSAKGLVPDEQGGRLALGRDVALTVLPPPARSPRGLPGETLLLRRPPGT